MRFNSSIEIWIWPKRGLSNKFVRTSRQRQDLEENEPTANLEVSCVTLKLCLTFFKLRMPIAPLQNNAFLKFHLLRLIYDFHVMWYLAHFQRNGESTNYLLVLSIWLNGFQ
jgi:hypothetical protein